ncbi:MAG: hypothetical protein ABIW47_07460 [Ginsengibacter sp.]|jgi:hypothetical protein
MQQSLFEKNDIKTNKKTDLIISSNKQKPLNRQQIAFNKLIKKIENLREELKTTSDDLDKQLAYYGKEIHPLERKVNEKRKEILRIIFPQFKSNKKIKGEEKKTLKRFIISFLQDIFSNDSNPPEQDLKEIFKAVTGESFEKAAGTEFAMMKDEMENMFRENGFEFDLGDLNKDMSEEEVIAKMKELHDKIYEREEEAYAKKSMRKKTAKQLEKEAKNKELEEARNKNIKSIYKQLVRALHPDLEQDELVKAKKERLMQRLTVAYENNDLHEMLSLEMEFINKEENNIDKLTSEKLAIYNQVLKEQIQELEQQKQMLFHNSRFLPLMRYERINSSFNLKAEKENLNNLNESMEHSLKKLNGKSCLAEIRKVLVHFEMSEWNFFDEDDDDDDEEDFWDWDI